MIEASRLFLSMMVFAIRSTVNAEKTTSLSTSFRRNMGSFQCSDFWCQLGADILGEAAADRPDAVSLSSDGSVVAIGAPYNDGAGFASGHARVFFFDDTISEWQQRGDDIDGAAACDLFGYSISLSSSGDIIAIGGIYNDGNGDNSGHTRIYAWNANDESWSQRGEDINGDLPGDQSGSAVSLSADGSIVAIGAYGTDPNGSSSGNVRVYAFNTNTGAWVQFGGDLQGEAAGDYFGGTVSLSSDGNTVASGGRFNDGNGFVAGHARVYAYENSIWVQLGEDLDGEFGGDFSGEHSLSSDGRTIAIGASCNDGNGYYSGHVRVFTYIQNAWQQIGSDIDGESAFDSSGESVSLSADGRTVAIGAIGNNGYAGHARIFTLKTNTLEWEQKGEDIDGLGGDQFGAFISLSSDGNTVAIGSKLGFGDLGFVRVMKYTPPTPTVSPAPTSTPTACSGQELIVDLTTDGFAYETAWTVRRDSGAGEVVMSSPVLNPDTTYSTEECLNEGCYVFTITDSYGDGICCSYGNGSFSVTLDGEEILTGSDFGSSLTEDFCIEGPTPTPCYDSILPIAFDGNEVSCAAIGSNNFCIAEQAKMHCPLTCNACSEYQCQDSDLPLAYNDQTFQCSQLPDAVFDTYCDAAILFTVCRASCQICVNN